MKRKTLALLLLFTLAVFPAVARAAAIGLPDPAEISVNEDTPSPVDGISFLAVGAGSETITATFAVASGTLNAASTADITVGGTPTSLTLTGMIEKIDAFIAAKSLTFTTALNSTEDVVLTVSVSESLSATATLKVTAVNDAPTVTAPSGINVTEGAPSALSGISFSDVDAGLADVTATFSVASGTLNAAPMGGVVIGGAPNSLTLTGTIGNINALIAAGNLTFTAAPGSPANVTLTVLIDDNGNTGIGGTQTDEDTVTLSVAPANTAPELTLPGAQTVVSSQTLVFSAANSNALSVSDADGDALTLTLSATNGTLTLGTTAGLTSVSGNGTDNVICTGPITNINAALSGMSFTPAGGFTGAATISVGASDGALPASGTIAVTVSADSAYNANDLTRLRAFLNLASSVSGQTNGQRINAAYDENDPTTWTGVAWSAASPRRAVSIGKNGEWSGRSLKGKLDLRGLTELTDIDVSDNGITSLDIRDSAKLAALNCRDNSLTALDVSSNKKLTALICSGNLLAQLDARKCTALITLDCSENKLTALYLSAPGTLRTLDAADNSLTALDLSGYSKLISVNVRKNGLAALDLSASPGLTTLDCADNRLRLIRVDCGAGDMDLEANGSGYVELTLYDPDLKKDPEIRAVKMPGGNFIHWARDGVAVSTHEINTLSGKINSVLTAYFSPFTVTFDPQGGSAVASVTAAYNATILAPAAPTKTGYYFGGWYQEAACTNAWTFSSDKIVRDTTLYAKWTTSSGGGGGGGGGQTQITGLPDSYTLYVGGRVTWTPNPTGGEFKWNTSHLSATTTATSITFTALKAGSTTVTYTVNGVTKSIAVTIKASGLPATGQSALLPASLLALSLLFGVAGLYRFGKRKAN